jgi:hypothetical protein
MAFDHSFSGKIYERPTEKSGEGGGEGASAEQFFFFWVSSKSLSFFFLKHSTILSLAVIRKKIKDTTIIKYV